MKSFSLVSNRYKQIKIVTAVIILFLSFIIIPAGGETSNINYGYKTNLNKAASIFKGEESFDEAG